MFLEVELDGRGAVGLNCPENLHVLSLPRADSGRVGGTLWDQCVRGNQYLDSLGYDLMLLLVSFPPSFLYVF